MAEGCHTPPSKVGSGAPETAKEESSTADTREESKKEVNRPPPVETSNNRDEVAKSEEKEQEQASSPRKGVTFGGEEKSPSHVDRQLVASFKRVESFQIPEGSPITDDQHIRMVEFYNEVMVAKDKYGQFSPEYYTKLYGLCRHVNKVMTKNPKIEMTMTLLATRSLGVSESVPWDQRGASEDYRKILNDGKAKAPGQMIRKLGGLQTLPTEVQTALSEHGDYIANITTDLEIEAATKWAPPPSAVDPERKRSILKNPSSPQQSPQKSPNPEEKSLERQLSGGSLSSLNRRESFVIPQGSKLTTEESNRLLKAYNDLQETIDNLGRQSPEYYFGVYSLLGESNQLSGKSTKIEGALTVMATRAKGVVDARLLPADLAASEDYKKVLSDGRSKASKQITNKLSLVETLPDPVREAFRSHIAYHESTTPEQEEQVAKEGFIRTVQEQQSPTAEGVQPPPAAVASEKSSQEQAPQKSPDATSVPPAEAATNDNSQKSPDPEEEPPTGLNRMESFVIPQGSKLTPAQHDALLKSFNDLQQTIDTKGKQSPEYYLRICNLLAESNAASGKSAKIENALTVMATRALGVAQANLAPVDLAASEDYKKVLSDGRSKASKQITNKLCLVETLPDPVREAFRSHIAYHESTTPEQEEQVAKEGFVPVEKPVQQEERKSSPVPSSTAAPEEETDTQKQEQPTQQDDATKTEEAVHQEPQPQKDETIHTTGDVAPSTQQSVEEAPVSQNDEQETIQAQPQPDEEKEQQGASEEPQQTQEKKGENPSASETAPSESADEGTAPPPKQQGNGSDVVEEHQQVQPDAMATAQQPEQQQQAHEEEVPQQQSTQQEPTSQHQQQSQSAPQDQHRPKEEPPQQDQQQPPTEEQNWYTGDSEHPPFYVRHWQPKKAERLQTPPHSIASLWKELEKIKLRKEERKGLFGIRDGSSGPGGYGAAAGPGAQTNKEMKDGDLAPPPKMKLAPLDKKPLIHNPSPTKSDASDSDYYGTPSKSRLELLREEALRLQGTHGSNLTKTQIERLKASSPTKQLTAANMDKKKSTASPGAKAGPEVRRQPPIHRKLAPIGKSNAPPMRR